MHFCNETSSLFLSETKYKNVVETVESDPPKVQKQAEAKQDDVINPQNCNFKYLYMENATNPPKSTVELG